MRSPFAFNEHSTSCCATGTNGSEMLRILQAARAWKIQAARPMLQRLKTTPDFSDHRRSTIFRDGIVELLRQDQNSPATPSTAAAPYLWDGLDAIGFTAAIEVGGWSVSWPCGCTRWDDIVVNVSDPTSGEIVPCRHLSSLAHLERHWQAAVKSARKSNWPKSVKRIDKAKKPNTIPHVHFKDDTALNFDGGWRHPSRSLNDRERTWLLDIGWVLPS